MSRLTEKLLVQGPQTVDDRPFTEVLQEEHLTRELQDTILYALAFADAAQSQPPPSHSHLQPGQGAHQQTGQQSAGASSAATSDQHADGAHPGSSTGSSNGSGSACPVNSAAQQGKSRAADRRSSETSSVDKRSAGEQADDIAGGSVSPSRARQPSIESRGLMSHAQGMDALGQYMTSAGR